MVWGTYLLIFKRITKHINMNMNSIILSTDYYATCLYKPYTYTQTLSELIITITDLFRTLDL